MAERRQVFSTSLVCNCDVPRISQIVKLQLLALDIQQHQLAL